MKNTKSASEMLKGYCGIFATRFRTLMEKHTINGKKLTQDYLANYLGVKRQTISQYFNGSTLPQLEKMYLIANFFNVSVDYLMGFVNAESVDIYNKKISQIIGLNDEAINNLKTTNKDNKTNIQVVNTLLNEKVGGLEVLHSISSFLEFDKTTYSAMPNDIIKAYNGKIYTIDGDKMELILLAQVQDKLRQLKHTKEV